MKNRINLFKEIPRGFLEKSIYPELTKVRGIGMNSLQKILLNLGLPFNLKIQELTSEMKDNLQEAFLKERIERELYLAERLIIENQQAICSYRGIRHLNKLKLRGQRTKSTGRKKKKVRVKK